MKKIIALFLSFIICVSFCACGKTPQSTNSRNTDITENVNTPPEQENESSSLNVSENVPQSTSNPSSKPKPTDNAKSETKKSPMQSETGTVPAVKPDEAETTAAPPAKAVCTVQVECKQILSKKNKFKKDESLISADGVILSPVKVYLDDGETAFDALKKACAENGIALNAQSSSFGGVYVVGIGGIEEKDCGVQSGWIYTVNGQSPSVSISKYKVKNGDSLVLSYVC